LGGSSVAGLTTEHDVYTSSLEKVEALKQLTADMHKQYSSVVRPINDTTSEYVVSTVKHFYERLVIIQYGIKNTMDDQILTNVNLKIENFVSESGLTVKGVIPLAEGDSIKVAEMRFIYLLLDRTGSSQPYPQAKVKASLSMMIAEIDVDTEEEVGTYEEDFDIAEV